MRLINADVLIEILTTAIRNMKGVAKFLNAEDDPEIKMEIKAYTDILNGVKEQPTIEPDLKWIPCSERLPKPYEYCLWTTTDGRVIYHHCDGLFSNYTAWMPLPEAYRGDQR